MVKVLLYRILPWKPAEYRLKMFAHVDSEILYISSLENNNVLTAIFYDFSALECSVCIYEGITALKFRYT